MVRRLLPLGPLLVILGALVLIVASGTEITAALRAWLAGGPWPRGVLLDALVASSAVLIVVAVLMTRRSVIRTARAEEALRESEERLRLVANNVPALISYVDRDQRFRFSNRTYDDWFGIPQERMVGRTVAEVFGEENHARMKPHFERVLAGEEVEFEFAMDQNAASAAARALAGRLRAASRPRGRGARLLHARQRRHRAQARAGGPALRRDPAPARRAPPGVPRAPRHPHRPAEPGDVPGTCARSGGARPTPRQDRRRAVHRPRQLQASERRARPRRGRRPAQGDRLAPARLRARRRLHRAHRRRRVLRAAAGHRRAARGGRGGAEAGARARPGLHRVGEHRAALGREHRHRLRAAGRRTTWRRCCGSPTPRCTGPRSRPQPLPVLLGDAQPGRGGRARRWPRSCAPASRATSYSSSTSRASTSRRARWSAPKRCCAGAIRSSACSRRKPSCRLRTRAACWCRSATGRCAKPARRHGAGATPASSRSAWSSTSPRASCARRSLAGEVRSGAGGEWPARRVRC